MANEYDKKSHNHIHSSVRWRQRIQIPTQQQEHLKKSNHLPKQDNCNARKDKTHHKAWVKHKKNTTLNGGNNKHRISDNIITSFEWTAADATSDIYSTQILLLLKHKYCFNSRGRNKQIKLTYCNETKKMALNLETVMHKSQVEP